MKICITHAWHDKVTKNHIIWCNPIMVYERMLSKFNANADIKAIQDIDFTEYDKIILFITGKIDEKIENKIIESGVEVIFIADDPNYEININPELIKKSIMMNSYQLLSFNSINKDDGVLKEALPHYKFNRPKAYRFFPMGVLPLYSNWYISQIKQLNQLKYREDLVRQSLKTKSIYCGSLKEDRFKKFTKEEFDNGIDFFTNRLNKQKLNELTGLDTKNIICHKKITPYEVVHAMTFMDNVYFLLEDRMQLMNNIYLRYAEMAYSGARIIIKGEPYQIKEEYFKLRSWGMTKDNILPVEALKSAWKPYLTIIDNEIKKILEI